MPATDLIGMFVTGYNVTGSYPWGEKVKARVRGVSSDCKTVLLEDNNDHQLGWSNVLDVQAVYDE